MALRLLAILVRLGIGLALFYVTLSLIVAAVRSPQVQQTFIAIGMLLSILWWLWTKLPDWLQEALRSFWIRRHDDAE